MSEMLEKVARAIWAERQRYAREANGIELEDFDEVLFSGEDVTVAAANNVWGEARAALLALREPTEGMSLAGHKVNRWTNPIRCDNPDCVYSVRLSPDEAFRAMIDAALTETQETSE